ncbi:MAG: 16S rRNA (uracil(1498)-N(3))-methyltransferase [Gemmataceae bacterium]|nr:16S rRNA (uracil(1498)-N(3))-methyltransferase [Gemmataceae bacterium]
MSERYYVDTLLGPGLVELDGPEAHHLTSVCRARPGDVVCLFNGDGREYLARVASAERRRVTLDITEVTTPQRELPLRLEVAAPLPKGDRAQFLVEKLTELGVTSFVPLSTRRSVVHPREAKLEKLQRYVIEASKQCGRNVLMEVKSLESWESYARRAELPALRVLAHPGGTAQEALTPGSALTVAVGPEGGFTDEEVEMARSAGWRLMDLGPRILRVETAALVLAAWAGSPS